MVRHPLRRALLALVMVLAGLGFVATTEAAADDPQVCGYVRYGHEPTSTVPYLDFCEEPCEGVGPHVPPGDVGGFNYDVYICVWGI